MTRWLLRKHTHESMWLCMACSLMIFVFCWARVWIVCQFDLEQFRPILQQLRPFEKFLPVPLEQLLTYSGSLAMTYHEPVLMLCILVWAIARGSDVVSGEINRGTMEILLAQPISRFQWLWTHAAIGTIGLGLLCLAAWLGIAAGVHTNVIKQQISPRIELNIPLTPLQIPIAVGPSRTVETPLAELVDVQLFLAPTCQLFTLGFFMLGLSGMLSCFDRYRWRTLGGVIGLYIVQLLLLLLSRASPGSEWVGYFTFLSAYQPDATVFFSRDWLGQGWWFSVPLERRSTSWPYPIGPLGLSTLLLVLGLLFWGIGAWRFRTRDIPAPV